MNIVLHCDENCIEFHEYPIDIQHIRHLAIKTKLFQGAYIANNPSMHFCSHSQLYDLGGRRGEEDWLDHPWPWLDNHRTCQQAPRGVRLLDALHRHGGNVDVIACDLPIIPYTTAPCAAELLEALWRPSGSSYLVWQQLEVCWTYSVWLYTLYQGFLLNWLL